MAVGLSIYIYIYIYKSDKTLDEFDISNCIYRHVFFNKEIDK